MRRRRGEKVVRLRRRSSEGELGGCLGGIGEAAPPAAEVAAAPPTHMPHQHHSSSTSARSSSSSKCECRVIVSVAVLHDGAYALL